MIRDNSNVVILFETCDNTNLRVAFDCYVREMNYDKFKELANFCWKKPYDFLVINMENADKFSRNFNEIINVGTHSTFHVDVERRTWNGCRT